MAKWKKRRRRRRKTKSYSSYLKKKYKDTSSVVTSRRLLFLAKLGLVGIVLVFLGTLLMFPLLAVNLPSPDKVIRREGFATKILDRNGEVLYEVFADEKRTPVEFEDIPESLKEATIAIEDKNFYVHQGFDPFGMVRGFSRLITRGRAQGGSTLTQQLVKNVLLSSERTVTRKVKEFVLAVQIERKYNKDEILQMYLNEAPYGGTAWGVGAAAETYFGKEVKDLNTLESAILAGLPQRPSVYSPYSTYPDAYKARVTHVLRRMREDGYITSEEEEKALEDLETYEFVGRGASYKAPHFVQYVQEKLIETYGENAVEGGGLRVTTTLDIDLQQKAQEIVAEEIEKVENLHITNGAAVVIDPDTGEILSMVGSKDFYAEDYDGQVNVTQSLRQPGSAIKPIVYLTGVRKGYTASTLFMDVPTEFPGGAGQPPYKPVNYDGKYRGPVQMRYALANSINVPAVKMISLVGVKDMLDMAYELGIESLEPTKETLSRVGLSVALGGGEVRLTELTSAFGTFANEGHKVNPVAILKVEDSKGKVLEENKPQRGKRVISPEESFIIADILSDNEARTAVFGPNSLLNIPGWQIAVKTGTTNDKRDNWTVGGNNHAIVGVWVGNNDNSAMKQVASGVTGASPIWRKIILETLNGKENIGFKKPGGIVTLGVDKVSGYAAHDGFASRQEHFLAGTEPGEDPVHVKLKICKSDGKLATPADIAAGNYEEKEYFVFKAEDPFATAGDDNKWQQGINEWLSTQDEPKYHPPTDYCGTENPVNVEFRSPKEHDSNLPNEFQVEVRANSTKDIQEVRLEVDGERVVTWNSLPYQKTLSLEEGVHEIRAIAKDVEDNESERRITVGVGVEWDYTPSPTPTLTNTPTPTVSEEE